RRGPDREVAGRSSRGGRGRGGGDRAVAAEESRGALGGAGVVPGAVGMAVVRRDAVGQRLVGCSSRHQLEVTILAAARCSRRAPKLTNRRRGSSARMTSQPAASLDRRHPMLDRLLPRHADNSYRGSKIALWLFGLVVLLKLVIALNSLFNGHQVASS